MTAPSAPASPPDSVQNKTQMHRWMQRMSDSTRRCYLLGRDTMLDQIAGRPAGSVLEMGCGTARNLRVLDDQAPHHTLYGLAPSLAMLATAREKLERAGCTERVSLAQGLPQDLQPKKQFGVDKTFDVIFFSYVLSMMPAWTDALGAALDHLAPDGRLYIVDFLDPDDRPSVVDTALRSGLRLFGVAPRLDPLRTLQTLDADGRLSCSITPLARRYAYLATVTPHGSASSPPPRQLAPSAPTEDTIEPKQFRRGNVLPV